MNSTPLRQLHEAGGAQFSEDDALPLSYGDVCAEYEAIQHGIALLDFSNEGKLEISGKNAVQFINGLVTNEIKTLAPGQGNSTAFLDVHGKTQAICRIYNTGDHLLLTTHSERREKVFKNLNRFTLAGEFFLRDVSEQQALLSIQGARAAELLASLTSEPIDDSIDGKLYQRTIAGHSILIVAHSRCCQPGFDLFVSAEVAAQVWLTLLERGSEFGARAVGREAFNIARIEAGVPLETIDVNETNVLVEAGFANAVSYSKGCYLGQEIIARIYFRGQPAKRLLKLSITAAELPPAGAELFASDGKKVGTVTSVARHPVNDSIVALGYVHRNYLAKDTALTIKVSDNECGTAIVTEGIAETETAQPAGPVVSHNISQIIT